MNDWNDLKFFLAIAHNGTVSGAARLLGVNYTTVIRRLNSFEEAMGFTVFERHSHGYTLTRAGNALLPSAQKIENEFIALSNLAEGNDCNLSGTVRIATTDLLSATLMPDIGQFLYQHPDIDFEIISDSFTVDLANREADIAIRITNQAPSDHLLSRKIGVVSGSIYASNTYIDRKKSGEKACSLYLPEEHTWIGWDDNLLNNITSRFIGDYIPKSATVACKVNSGLSLLQAIQSGIGVGYLWHFVGDNDSNLQRVYPDKEHKIGLWLLINKDLYATPRFRAVMSFLEETIKNNDIFLDSSDLE